MRNLVQTLKTATGILLAVLLLTTGLKIEAQAVSIASVTARATDQSGAVVNAAQVKITALSTNAVQSAGTEANGLYSFPSLPIGDYTLEVTAPGFETYSQKGLASTLWLNSLLKPAFCIPVAWSMPLQNPVRTSGTAMYSNSFAMTL